MTFINLTGHEVHEINSHTIWPALNEKMVVIMTTKKYKIEGVQIKDSVITGLQNYLLPPEKEDTAYIVPNLVANAIYGRKDIYSPGNVIRRKGQPEACNGLRHCYNEHPSN